MNGALTHTSVRGVAGVWITHHAEWSSYEQIYLGLLQTRSNYRWSTTWLIQTPDTKRSWAEETPEHPRPGATRLVAVTRNPSALHRFHHTSKSRCHSATAWERAKVRVLSVWHIPLVGVSVIYPYEALKCSSWHSQPKTSSFPGAAPMFLPPSRLEATRCNWKHTAAIVLDHHASPWSSAQLLFLYFRIYNKVDLYFFFSRFMSPESKKFNNNNNVYIKIREHGDNHCSYKSLVV